MSGLDGTSGLDEDTEDPDPWEKQAQVPLKQRNQMWWAGVALPTTLLVAWIVATALWIFGVL